MSNLKDIQHRTLAGRARPLAMATSTVCSMLSTLCIASNTATNVKANKTRRVALSLASSSTFGVGPALKFSFQCKRRRPVTAMATSEEEEEEAAEGGEGESVVVSRPNFEDWPEETEEEISAAYEAIYGPAYSGVSVLGNDVDAVDKLHPTGLKLRKKPGKIKDGFEERVVQVRRVTKVVKGGKRMSFRAIVVVGDKKGRVGVGVGKAREVISAVQKSAADARRHVVTVPMTKYSTFPHRADGHYGAAHVMLRPASPGTGVIAGGAVKVMLEMAGVVNALGKQLRSENPLNNARAVVNAVSQMRQFREVAERRGIPMEELWQ